jgi:hypothetical protein
MKNIINSVLLLAILAMQVAFLYLLLNPVNIYNQLTSVNVINEVTKDKNLPPNELPQIGVVGDGKNLADIEVIKKTNAIDADVYKDAKNGDYVLGYTNKLIIYRPSEKKVIYEGPSSQQKLASSKQTLVTQVMNKVMSSNLLPKDYQGVPNISIVTSPEELKKNGDLYKDAQANDLVATFSTGLIAIYRPSNDTIVKSGTVSTVIK